MEIRQRFEELCNIPDASPKKITQQRARRVHQAKNPT